MRSLEAASEGRRATNSITHGPAEVTGNLLKGRARRNGRAVQPRAKYLVRRFSAGVACLVLVAATVALPESHFSQAGLPDPATLLRQVRDNQARLDKGRENYTFHAIQTTRFFDKNGGLKKVETEEDEIFFVNGHQIQKLLQKNGKNLTADQAKKEQARVNKEALKYAKPNQDDPTKDEITVARLLSIIRFSRVRRVTLNGRSTIALDFVGDPHAKTHGRDEEALKKISGTLWIDEADREVSRMSATLDENYHVGFGLLASVAKGSNLVFEQAYIRNEAWLPTSIQMHLQAKAFLLVGLRAELEIRFEGYRKFQATAVQQPGATVLSKP